MPVFTKSINAKISKAASSKRSEAAVFGRANSSIERAKEQLDEIIDRDPSSIRVQNDPNTVGLFGFDTTDLPVESLKQSLIPQINTSRQPKSIREATGSKVRFTYKVNYPSQAKIYSDASLNLPWISQTWVEKLQRGFGNLERFLFFPGRGRSEFGIQSKGKAKNKIADPRDPDYLNRIRRGFLELLKR